MGFTYDSYITEEDFETVSDTNAGNVLMKALLLTDEQVERYGQMMQNLTDDEKNNISYEDYVQDCTGPAGKRCDKLYRNAHRLYRAGGSGSRKSGTVQRAL